jgi:hypothetical protein
MRAADAHYRSLTASAGVKPARWDGRDLSGLACFPRLEHLELQFNGIEQLQEVSSLRQLRFLAVGPPPPVSDSDKGMEGVLSNKPKDLGFLRSLSTLRELHLGSLSLESLSTLPALPALQTLSLQDNHLVDIALLATFTSLEKLYLGHNRLTTIRPLAALIRLKELDVSGNELSSTVDFDKARAAALIEETKRQGLDSTPLDVFGLVSGTKLDLSFNRLCAEGAVGLTWLLWAEVIGKDVQNC